MTTEVTDELSDLRARVGELEARAVAAEELVEELRDVSSIARSQTHAVVMHTFGLSPTQATLVCMFYQGGIWERAQIERALGEDRERHWTVVDFHMRALRQRLDGFGIEIETLPHGDGWRMALSMKKKTERELRKNFELMGA